MCFGDRVSRPGNIARKRMVLVGWRGITKRHDPDFEPAAHGKCEGSCGVEGPIARCRQPAGDLFGPLVELACEIGSRHAGIILKQFQDGSMEIVAQFALIVTEMARCELDAIAYLGDPRRCP